MARTRYVIGFTRTGESNGDKLCGFLPGAALRLPPVPSQWLVFFAAADRDDLMRRTERAEAAKAEVCVWVCVWCVGVRVVSFVCDV